MRSYWSRLDSHSTVTGVHTLKGEIWTQIHRRTQCKREGGDWGDVSTSQGTPKMGSKPPEARRESWQIPTNSEGTNYVNSLILDFWPPEPKTISFGYSSQLVCGTLLSQHDQTHPPSSAVTQPSSPSALSQFIGPFSDSIRLFPFTASPGLLMGSHQSCVFFSSQQKLPIYLFRE